MGFGSLDLSAAIKSQAEMRTIGYPYSVEYEINTQNNRFYQYESSGKFLKRMENCVSHTCDTLPGMSGGPVQVFSEADGTWAISGIHVGGGEGGKYNLACHLSKALLEDVHLFWDHTPMDVSEV